MAKIEVKLNQAGIRKYLKSDSVRAEVNRRAEAIRARAGEGYAVKPHTTDRARAVVTTTDYESRRRESKQGNLRRAIGGG